MRIVDGRILDDDGRTLILRGVNLGGDAKNPFGPLGWGLRPESLKDPANASFVGRPFPLEDAESHFERLSRAGLTFQRLVITWEALEHAGPGLYDEAYLAYLRKVLDVAARKGVSVFIDPHQDVWSRWTGGDGAPAWTLEKLGFNLDKIDATGAAITRQRYTEFHKTAKHPEGEPFPRMMWPSNYNRYAAATMFSLFFAGKTYAPDLIVNGENVQDWLQGHYVAAFRHCYRRLKNCSAIAGWGVMNEPYPGFIGHANLELSENPVMPMGPRPSPWEAIRAASGYAVEVPVYKTGSIFKPKRELFNPGGQTLFREGFSCPWKQAGVWADGDSAHGGEPRLLRRDHFARFNGSPVNFMKDFHRPFILKFIEAQREVNSNAFFFIEGTPPGRNDAQHPEWDKRELLGLEAAGTADVAADAANIANTNIVNAFHWYDGFSLFMKRFNHRFTVDTGKSAALILGQKNVQSFFNRCLAKSVKWSVERMSNAPSLLGEFGLAFDMNKRRAFSTGDYSMHEEALTMYYNAVDANLLHSTIWNYTADNTNVHGDGWNDEDLSIFSEGKERATAGWKRPYPMATAGEPVSINWNRKKNVFHYRFNADGNITAPTVIYLPGENFGPKTAVNTSLRFEFSQDEQRLLVFNDGKTREVEIVVVADLR